MTQVVLCTVKYQASWTLALSIVHDKASKFIYNQSICHKNTHKKIRIKTKHDYGLIFHEINPVVQNLDHMLFICLKSWHASRYRVLLCLMTNLKNLYLGGYVEAFNLFNSVCHNDV